jgi:catechol 2,3-dioxygenase-like lactoylglutathione lyase family enzyme
MIQSIDHIVILVSDLDEAVRDYTELGFNVVPGGEHAGGVSHNALIAFGDGSYIELIAFRGHVPKEHHFYREGVTEGLITFALLPGAIETDVEAARARGVEYDGPTPGGRLRPDGTRLEWQIATPHTHDLPFLCGDVTPRELRVPGGEARSHKNGATGIAYLTIETRNLQLSTQRYRALLGIEPTISKGDDRDTTEWFALNGANIILAPGTQPNWEGPIALNLFSTQQISLDERLTHHVPLFINPR